MKTTWGSTNRYIDKEGVYEQCDMWAVDYYSAITDEEVLPFATAWMHLEGIMPSKIS